MIITLCGSTKFKSVFNRVAQRISLMGHIVLTPTIFSHADNIELTEEKFQTLKKVHLDKIAMSDAIIIINVDGYIGETTREEIEYAKKLNKEIIYLKDQ